MILTVAALATASLPFAPPATPLHYRTTQERAGPGGTTLHFTMRKTIRFAATATGWRATLVMTGIESDAPPATRATFEAGLRPFLNVPVVVEIDRSGAPGAVIDGARTWARVTASFAAVLRDLERRQVPLAQRTQFARYLEEVGKATPEARDARLRQGVADLLPGTLPLLQPGQSAPYREQRLSPAGQPQARDGILSAEGEAAGQRRYQLTVPTGASTRETTTITLASDTGMLVARRRISQFALPDRTVEIVEETRRIP